MMSSELPSRLKNSTLSKTLLILLFWKIIILSLAIGMRGKLPFQEQRSAQHFGLRQPYILRVWGNFDGFQYMRVAESGYLRDNTPFFPLFPATMYVLHTGLVMSYVVAGLIVAHVTFAGALFFFYALLKREGFEKNWILFLVLLLLYPTSFFFGAVYNDSLFLFFSAGCLFFSRKKVWILASILGALATATRLNGLALGVFMAVEFMSSQIERDDDWKLMAYIKALFQIRTWKSVWESKIWTGLFIPLTYLLYLSYLQKTFGSWKVIHEAMAVWGQDKVVFPLVVFYRYIRIFMNVEVWSLGYLVALVEFLFTVFYVAISIYSIRKIRFSYWVFMAISFIIPALTGTFAGMPRYALHVFPFFLTVLLLWKQLPIWGRGVLIFVFAFLQSLILLLFTSGYFVT